MTDSNDIPKPHRPSPELLAVLERRPDFFFVIPSVDGRNHLVCEAADLGNPIFSGTQEDAQLVASAKNTQALERRQRAAWDAIFNAKPETGNS